MGLCCTTSQTRYPLASTSSSSKNALSQRVFLGTEESNSL